ncbi:putative basic amino acid antiporter YfcC [Crassaminicella thermophila]|uniref:Putative basic amino acid antiporter YfcC n=1 Tax=Crassaminicella thermophila TaxID=2599308 RepID=A0A5C0SDU6_CRATE|nr:TIGR00366 family protein [Crassaminicella thermophila]QEK11119.1 putative basic amino acid antiporter YfcC [Crassaminicella thermophila]
MAPVEMELKSEKKKLKKKRFKMPTTASLLMLMILFSSILTYIVPAGEFERVFDEATKRTLVVAGTFTQVDQSPIGFWKILSSIFEGIVHASEIIAFVFVVGGVFGVVIKSGAINAALGKLIKKLSGRENILIILVMSAFAAGGASFGMAEETLPFVALLVATCLALGYDRIVAVSLVCIGVYAGYSAGPINPFNVGIAHGISELPLFSGIGLRTVLMFGGLIIAIHHTLRYAKKVKDNPQKSLVANIKYDKVREEFNVDYELTRKHKVILIVILLTLIGLVFGVLKYGWYLSEISALFMLMGIVVGLIHFDADFNEFTEEFLKGAREMTTAALLIGFSRAILVVLENGKIMDTIVYALSLPLQSLNSILAAWGMYFTQGIINFILPSSTGQAVVVMPIMASLSDIIGVTRQVAVQAYQAGDGYWNMITPTHPVLMASLGIAGIPFSKWFKFAVPLVLKWTIWVMVILAIGVITNWGPF